MRHYTQLTSGQRYQISALLKTSQSLTKIAEVIGVHKSTVSREIQRNKGLRGYQPNQAQQFAESRHKQKSKRCLTELHWAIIEDYLKLDWSPEQISGRLAVCKLFSVSHERIYQHIYADKACGGTLHRHLRRKKKYGKRINGKSPRGQIPHRISIDERPSVVDTKERVGDWEVDTVIGKGHKQAIVSLVERKTKTTLIRKVEKRTADNVKNAIISMLKPFKGLVHTITADNGKEFAMHREIAKELKTDFYFAHPYASWERGLNENTNGLIRQYFPKKSSFTELADKDMEQVMDQLNNRPRKTLRFRTPNEVLYEHLVALHL